MVPNFLLFAPFKYFRAPKLCPKSFESNHLQDLSIQTFVHNYSSYSALAECLAASDLLHEEELNHVVSRYYPQVFNLQWPKLAT